PAAGLVVRFLKGSWILITRSGSSACWVNGPSMPLASQPPNRVSEAKLGQSRSTGKPDRTLIRLPTLPTAFLRGKQPSPCPTRTFWASLPPCQHRCRGAMIPSWTIFEAGNKKVALDGNAQGYTHAARQQSDGRWTSKRGARQDIIHESLQALEGTEYGFSRCFLKR